MLKNVQFASTKNYIELFIALKTVVYFFVFKLFLTNLCQAIDPIYFML